MLASTSAPGLQAGAVTRSLCTLAFLALAWPALAHGEQLIAYLAGAAAATLIGIVVGLIVLGTSRVQGWSRLVATAAVPLAPILAYLALSAAHSLALLLFITPLAPIAAALVCRLLLSPRPSVQPSTSNRA